MIDLCFRPIMWLLIYFLLIFLYHVSKADRDVVDVCIFVNEQYVAINWNYRWNIHPIVTCKEKDSLSYYLSIAEYWQTPCSFDSLDKSFRTAMQPQPKRVYLHLSIKSYNEAILSCVCISFARQDVILFLLVIMINPYFFGRPFLRQQNRKRERDFDFCRRVEILCEVRNHIVLFTWNFIIQPEHKLKGIDTIFNLDANCTCALVIR